MQFTEIDLDHLVCKNTWQYHREIINLTRGGIPTYLPAIEEVDISFPHHHKNGEYTPKVHVYNLNQIQTKWNQILHLFIHNVLTFYYFTFNTECQTNCCI